VDDTVVGEDISGNNLSIVEEDASIFTDTVTMPPSRVVVVRPFDNSLETMISGKTW
jgi:hypothetical protein